MSTCSIVSDTEQKCNCVEDDVDGFETVDQDCYGHDLFYQLMFKFSTRCTLFYTTLGAKEQLIILLKVMRVFKFHSHFNSLSRDIANISGSSSSFVIICMANFINSRTRL